MKKHIYTLLFFLIYVVSFSQETKKEKINTIYVSNTQNVLLFFDSPIIQGISGHSNFKFGFNLEEESKYGIIRGEQGEKSNLHIITSNGNVYAFTLEHKEVISRYNYFIDPSNAVGNVNGEIVLKEKERILNKKPVENFENQNIINENQNEYFDHTENDVQNEYTEEIIDKKTGKEYRDPKKDESAYLYNRDRNEFYRKYCSNLESKSVVLKRYYTENSDIILYLEEISFNRNELYFKLRIENNSGLDYDINFVNFSKIARKKMKQSSSQAVDIPFVYSYNNFKTVPAGESKKAIYVFKKFGINRDKIVNVEVNEAKGERNINFEIGSKTINNPFR